MSEPLRITKEYQLRKEILEQELKEIEENYIKSLADYSLEHDQEFIDYFYWETNLKTTLLKDVMFGYSNLYQLTSSGKVSDFICMDCNREFQYIRKSRSTEQPNICHECYDKRSKLSNEKYEAFQKQKEQELFKLKTMPYKEYLKSGHWQNFRKRVLKHFDFCCQLCNKKQAEMHIHHRSYENKGEESYCDVILLCSECHAKFHDKLNKLEVK